VLVSIGIFNFTTNFIKKHRLKKRIIYTNVLLILTIIGSKAQQTKQFTYQNKWLHDAINHYEQSHYMQASVMLDNVAQANIVALTTLEKQDYLLYKNSSALKLNKPFCERAMKEFIANTVFTTYKERGNYVLAKYYYNQGDFEQAMPCYEQAGIEILNNNQISERNFELGYCYLVNQQLDKVDPLFASIKNIKTEYFTPGNYYYGVLSYYKKNYDEALKSFEKVKDDAQYKSVVPFYITELTYLKGQKEKALTMALSHLESKEKLYYDKELNALTGQLYLDKNEFENALPYLNNYISRSNGVRSEDRYKLAKANYEMGNLKEAITDFELVDNNSEYATLANYYIATSHLKNGNKQKAYEQFIANLSRFTEPAMKENVEFIIGKLSYDLGQDELAITQLNYFINTNKNSIYINEANEMLTYLYVKNKNFDAAIKKLNSLPTLSPSLKKIYQKANYARGIQMLMAGNPEEASYSFEESKKYKTDDAEIANLTIFWNAEASYRLGRYQKAHDGADDFLNASSNIASYAQFARNAHLLKAYVNYHNNEKDKMASELSMSRDPSANVLSNVSPLVLSDSIKPNFVPSNVPAIISAPFLFVYNVPEINTKIAYKPIPLKPLAINQKKIIQDHIPSYVKLGYGNINTPLVEIGAQILKQKTLNIYGHLNYIAQKDSVQNEASNFAADVTINKRIKENIVTVQLLNEVKRTTYYGFDRSLYKFKTEDIRQKYSYTEATGSLLSLSTEGKKFIVSPKITLGTYNDITSNVENSFLASLPVTTTFNDAKLTLTGIANIYTYNQSSNNKVNSLLSIQPTIYFKAKGIDFETGLFPTLANGNTMLLYNVKANKYFNMYNSNLSIVLKSTIIQNTFQEITTINPYVYTNYEQKQTKENSLIGKLEGSLINKTNYVLQAGFVNYNNMLFYLNDTARDYKQFNILYQNKVQTLLMSIAANYYLNNYIQLGGDLKLQPIIGNSSLKLSNPWHYQSYLATMYAVYSPNNKVTIKAITHVSPGVRVIEKKASYVAPIVKTNNSAIDFTVQSRFKLSNKLTGFIDVNNLFGSKYQRWYGYATYGTNFQVGIIKNFLQIAK
jgi:tetratricopeptide (TPR) repeat protein